MSKLLIQEPPLQVLPSLAVEIGLNEAIIIQQLHYWTLRSESGWVYNTLEDWGAQFPFWSEATIKRTIKKLKETGLIEVEQPSGQNRTNHYRLNYMGSICALEEVKVISSTDQSDPFSNTTETSTEKEAGQGEEKSGIDKLKVAGVFAHWQKVMGKDRARLTPERAAKIKARLLSYEPRDLMRAIDGCAGSEFHMKEGHNDLTLICRNDTKLEEFMAKPKPDADDDMFAGIGE